MEIPIQNFVIVGDQVSTSDDEPLHFKTVRQIYNLADFCNECGHCGLQCPEDGNPYFEKPRLFFDEESFQNDTHKQAFYFRKLNKLDAKLDGEKFSIEWQSERKSFVYTTEQALLELDERFQVIAHSSKTKTEVTVKMKPFHTLRILLESFAENQTTFGSIIARYHCDELSQRN